MIDSQSAALPRASRINYPEPPARDLLSEARPARRASVFSGILPGMTPDPAVSLSLTADEALILFEFLQRFSDDDCLRIEDQVEQRALWNLCGLLEKSLSVPLAADYATLLAEARDRLRDEA